MYKGCALSMIGTNPPGDGYHGDDALGDVVLEGIDPVDITLLKDGHAAIAINQLVTKYPGMCEYIYLVCLVLYVMIL